MRTAEGSKILFAEEELCGGVHGVEVESGSHACMGRVQERVFACDDTIVIGPFKGIKARMRIIGDGIETAYGNSRGEEVIESRGEIRRQGVGEIEMRDHHIGMDSCVGSAGESEGHGLTENRSESRFKYGLDGDAVGLRLGAVEGGAEI